MKNWKISKIAISNFKLFQSITLVLENSSLITLDGPNGFGKTSFFDAVELLLTGKIERIKRLGDAIAPGGRRRTSFSDNLLWNSKEDGALFVKAEFLSSEGESLVVTRKASSSLLESKKFNDPNDFSIYKLYKLKDFDSDEEEELSVDFLEDIFGNDFARSYGVLNYLEQGENKYLYSTNIKERKAGISHLLNTETLSNEIKRCENLSLRLSRGYLGVEADRKVDGLNKEIAELEKAISGESTSGQYFRIGNTDVIPSWDQVAPVVSSSAQDLRELLDTVKDVRNLVLNKTEVAIRLENERIDKFVKNNQELIKIVVAIGHHIDKYDNQKELNELLTIADAALAVLKTPAEEMVAERIDSIPTIFLKEDRKSLISDSIKRRDDYIARTSQTKLDLANVVRIRDELVILHRKVKIGGDESCPLCGHDWLVEKLLFEAIEDKKVKIEKELDVASNGLIFLLDLINEEVKKSVKKISEMKDDWVKIFDRDLFHLLETNKENFVRIKKFLSSLQERGINTPSDFSNESSVTSQRVYALESHILERKKLTNDCLPDNWSILFEANFTGFDRLNEINEDIFVEKDKYIRHQYYLFSNSTLLSKKTELSEQVRKNEAARRVKDKLSNLKILLESAERRYTKETISDIEILFHQYSGRLIQNFQRGLGLFIETNNGDSIKFCTAEKSDHDAILSMSSGQIAAIGVAFFLSLNRVYSKNQLILIDDPVQSMDEINVASLADLLRVELKDRQLIISTHEEDISAYFRYKFKRAGLSQKNIHMQEIHKG